MEPKPIVAKAHIRRDEIRQQAVDTIKGVFPFEGKRFSLHAEDVRVHPADYTTEDHKAAILRARTLAEPVRGTLVLKDKSGKVVDKVKNFNLLQLPYFTEHGTFVIGGSTYSVSNQLRMKPGVYTRKRRNEELEASFNLSKGDNFRVSMDPESGHFKMEYGTTQIPLYPVLKSLGVSDKDLSKHWNKDVVDVNRKAFEGKTDQVVGKLYERLVPTYAQKAGDDKVSAIKEVYANTAMDPEINKRTLGKPFSKVDPAALMAASGKLLKAYSNEADFDERDSLAFKKLMTVDDFLRERIQLDSRDIQRKVLSRIDTPAMELKRVIPNSPFTKSVHRFLSTSQLSNNPDQINPIEMLDAAVRATSMGEGGIENIRAIPQEARRLHSSHAGVFDPVRSPENDRAGIDIRTTLFTAKDKNGDMYLPVRDLRQGKMRYVPIAEVVDKTIAFPREDVAGRKKSGKLVDAIQGNAVRAVKASEVDFQFPTQHSLYSPASTLIPFMESIDGNRGTMGSKMQTQALPLANSEPPLVQVASYQPGRSMENMMADFIVPRSPVTGVIQKIQDGAIYIKPDKRKTAAEGDAVKVPFHRNFPLAAKTYLDHDVQVKPGERVEAGQHLAADAFVKNKTLALGRNLRTAYLPWRGLNSNDAIVVSQSAADKMASLHMYKKGLDVEKDMTADREAHRTYYGSMYTSDMYQNLTKEGVVKPGTIVKKGDLLVAAMRKTALSAESAMLGKLHKSLVKPFRDASVVWDHDTPGEVTDVLQTGGKIRMTVKTQEKLNVGDKICFTEDTEVLTKDGWKPVAQITPSDVCYTINSEGVIELREPTEIHHYPTAGKLYELRSQQVDLRVTENHNLYVRLRYDASYVLLPAVQVVGKRVRHKKNGTWLATTPALFSIPECDVAKNGKGSVKQQVAAERFSAVPMSAWLRFLGVFLANGSTTCHERSDRGSTEYCVNIHSVQGVTHTISGAQHQWIAGILQECGFPFTDCEDRMVIHSKQLTLYLRQFGHAQDKFVPPEIFTWGKEAVEWLLEGMIGCDGHKTLSGSTVYTTVSPRLADDVQRLALHAGYAANITIRHYNVPNWAPRYTVKFIIARCCPEVNHGHCHKQKGQEERLAISDEPVYGITLPNHTLYVRVNGKPVWSGNCGRYGNKGVVSTIIPDDQMLKDEEGRTIDVAVTPAGVVSRINPAQVLETAVAKVAEKTGKPIMVENFSKRNNVEWAKDLLKKNKVKDKETVYDPISGKQIPGVLVGPQYTLKLFKSTETNYSARGVEDYDVNQQPSGGGPEGAKALGSMEVNALLAHGAKNILREAAVLKGQKNDEFWRAYQLGLPLPQPKTTFAYDKFGTMLAGTGVKINKTDKYLRLSPLTDKEITKMAPARISNALLVRAKDLKPESGGLFDPVATGGTTGQKWARIDLEEPIVNPVFEKPVRSLLGMQQADFAKAIREDGGAEIRKQLAKLDTDKLAKETRAQLETAKGAERDVLIKKMKYLEGLKMSDLAPHDAYVLSKIPVIPPVFRPITPGRTGDLQVGDANYLYRDLILANDSMAVSKTLPQADQHNARKHLYDATKALFGLAEPVSPQARGRGVRGFIANISGPIPKQGFFQSKLLRKTQDVSGRGTIVPDATLGMDEVGIPEDMGWKMYQPFVVKRMVQRGYKALDAKNMVEKQDPVAWDFLQQEVKERPILLNRAPSLRRYNVLAAYPKLVPGKSIRIHELLAPIQAGDFDGDSMQIHVPIMPEAVSEAKNLTLSNMLLGDQWKSQTTVAPQHEATAALYRATAAKASGKTRKFKSKEEAMEAYHRGEITLSTPVEVG